MDKPLRFLRELLPFSRPSDNHGEVAELREALAGLGLLSGDEVMQELTTRLVPAMVRQPNLHMRFKLLDAARSAMENALQDAERLIGAAVLPLPGDVAGAALQADNLLKSLAQAYSGIVAEARHQKMDGGLGHLLHQATRRSMQMIVRRQMVAYRAYAAPSESSWLQLHDLFHTAHVRNLATHEDDEDSIAHHYAAALLLAYIDPSKFPRSELDMLRQIADTLSPLVRISDAVAPAGYRPQPGLFLVQPDQGNAGQPLLRAVEDAPMAGNLIVDCRAAVGALDRNLNREADQTVVPSLEAPEPLLQGARSALGGQSSRRFNRSRFRPRADLVAGLDNVVSLLEKGGLQRRLGDAPGQHPPSSEWALVNESPEGFGVRYVKGEKWRIEAGDIIGLRPRENDRLHICLVRRIASSSRGRLELGLQDIAVHGFPIDLPKSANGNNGRGILLPRLPGFNGQAGIITAPGHLPAGSEIVCAAADKTIRLKTGPCIEANDRLEFSLLVPVGG